MKESLYKKILLYGIVFLFIGAAVVPSISGYNNKISIQSTIEGPTSFPLNADYVNSYWKFDECSGNTLQDSSGNDYDGIIYGASWTSGQSGCALDFDGVDDYVDLDVHSGGIAFNKTDDVIFSLWFRSDSSDGGYMFCIAGEVHVPEAVIQLCPNGSVFFKVWTAVCGIPLWSDNEGFNDDEWHQVEIFFNGITSNPTVEMYIDGDFESRITKWLCEVENTHFKYGKIGRRALENEGYFEGLIDELKIIIYPGGNEQEPPTISGPTEGDPEVEYHYSLITNDPEGDDILLLYIDWDDGTVDEVTGPFESGEEVIVSHTWDENDRYEVKTKSKDYWHESRWSDPPYVVKIGNQPPEPPTITGPKYGDPDQELTYTFVAIDEEEEDVKYSIDWDDGTTTDIGYHASGEPVTAAHSWDTEDDYHITAQATDTHDKPGGLSVYHIRIGDQPPNKPSIYGTMQGIPDKIYDFGFVSTDPENDDITYDIDWGDGNIETDIGPFPSGEIISRSHSWDETGTYLIQARAKDEFDNPSVWSGQEIIVPRNKAFNFNLLELLFERFPRVFLTFRYLLG